MSRITLAYEPDLTRPDRRGAVYFTALKFRPTTSMHELLRKEKEWLDRRAAADAIAHQYDVGVFILPAFDNQFDPRYTDFYAAAPVVGKMPDLFFKEQFWEMKSYEGAFRPDDFTDMLADGKKQSPNIIILLHHDYDIQVLKRRARGYMRSNNLNRSVKYKIGRVLIADASGNIHEA